MSEEDLTKRQYLEVENMIKASVEPIISQLKEMNMSLHTMGSNIEKIKPMSMLASVVAGAFTSTIITIAAWLKAKGLI